MDLLLTGTPGPLLSFAERLIGAVAQAADLPPPQLGHRDAATLDSTVRESVLRGETRLLVCVDDPAASLGALVQAGFSPLDAARALTAAAAPLAGFATAESPRLLAGMTLAQAAAAILPGLGAPPRPMPVTEWPGDATLAQLAGGGSAEAGQLVEEVIRPAFTAAATAVAQPVIWSRAWLFWGDQPGAKLPRVLDLTGPARILAYGPYLHLSAGAWTVRATLAFSPAAVGAAFTVALFSDGDVCLGRGRFRPVAAGVFAASFAARVASPHTPVEFRLSNDSGAIAGEIGLDHILLTPDQSEA